MIPTLDAKCPGSGINILFDEFKKAIRVGSLEM
jgi:hypothetical protein